MASSRWVGERSRAEQTGGASSLKSGIEETVAKASAWIQAHASSPFFLFLHTYAVHKPYVAPPPYRDLLTDHGGGVLASRTKAGRAAHDLARYEEQVRYTDAVLASLFTLLDELDLTRRTIIVVTSDHGEAFGEHGFWAHGELREEVLRVPFIWRAPGLIAAGRRFPNAVGVGDVVPTILDLLRLAVPPYMQGVSLKMQLTRSDLPANYGLWRVVFSEKMHGRGNPPYPIIAAGGPWIAVFQRNGPGVVSLASGPGPAAPEHVGRAHRHGTYYEEHCKRARERIAAAASSGPQPIMPNPGLLRNLQALGYVQ